MGKYSFAYLFIYVLLTSSVHAQTILPVRVPIDPVTEFNRCYALLTGKRPDPNHPKLLEVIQAKQNSQNIAIDKCEELLNETVFDQDLNGSTGFPNTVSSDTSAVLNQMLRLFMTFFDTNNIETRPQGQVVFGEARQYSGIEGAEYLTELLFNPVQDFTDFTRGDYSVRSVRTHAASNANPFDGFYYVIPVVGNFSIFSRSLERGPLTGLKRRTDTENNEYIDFSGNANSLFNFFIGAGNPFASELLTTPIQPSPGPYSFLEVTTGTFTSKHGWGGGLYGQSGYIIANHGFNNHNEKSDGGFKVPRRLMHHIFKDTMCIDEAPLRTTDVVQEVAEYQTQFPNGTLAFRAGTACSSCHAAFDRGPYDSFYTGLVGDINFGNAPVFNPTTLITHFPTQSGLWIRDYNGNALGSGPEHFQEDISVQLPRNPTQPHLIEKDDRFFLRPDDFDLRYRNYDGDLVFDRVQLQPGESSVEKFGELMEQQDQLYVCMAKKMVKYFWGKDIPMMDPGDPRNPPLSYADQYYKEEIVALGLDFKSHRNLRQLMIDIMRHPIFSNTGFLGFKQ